MSIDNVYYDSFQKIAKAEIIDYLVNKIIHEADLTEPCSRSEAQNAICLATYNIMDKVFDETEKFS